MRIESVTWPQPQKTDVHALSSPQFAIIASVPSSYLREWVLRLAFLVKGYICIARQYRPCLYEDQVTVSESCDECVTV